MSEMLVRGCQEGAGAHLTVSVSVSVPLSVVVSSPVAVELTGMVGKVSVMDSVMGSVGRLRLVSVMLGKVSVSAVVVCALTASAAARTTASFMEVVLIVEVEMSVERVVESRGQLSADPNEGAGGRVLLAVASKVVYTIPST